MQAVFHFSICYLNWPYCFILAQSVQFSLLSQSSSLIGMEVYFLLEQKSHLRKLVVAISFAVQVMYPRPLIFIVSRFLYFMNFKHLFRFLSFSVSRMLLSSPLAFAQFVHYDGSGFTKCDDFWCDPYFINPCNIAEFLKFKISIKTFKWNIIIEKLFCRES